MKRHRPPKRGQTERQTGREKDGDGERDKEEGFGSVAGCHESKTRQKKIGNGMRPQKEQTEQNESLQNMR